jgi:RecJ-like exonuclease
MEKHFKKKFGRENRSFDRFSEGSRGRSFPPRRTVGTIIDLKGGDFFEGVVKIMRKTQPGPVIFAISDGYASVDAVIKDSDFNVDDVVQLSGKANERAGKLQVEIDSIRKANADFSSIIEKNSIPTERAFSIKSDRLEKMKPYFYKIAKRIRKAILENQSILIRHHADADGIIAGLAIEHSARKLMEKIGVNPEYNLYRSPSKAPFYEIADVFRDVVLTKRIIEGHGQKKPLIIVLDNGSTPEDVLGIKTLQSLSFEVIVIDHHNPVVLENKKTAVCPYVSFHLNPYMEGLDSKTCAGMLAYETARLIDESYDEPILPAIAGISDRCDIPETDSYIKNSGRTREELEKIGTAIDFIAYNMKHDAAKGLYEDLLINKNFVTIIGEEVKKGFETQLQSTLPYLRTQEIDGIIFSYIDLEKYTLRFKYPAPGKVIGAIHDIIAAEKEKMPVITLGCLSDMIIVRATKPVLPVQKIMKRLRKDIPNANVDGGGHECAGAIKFVSAHSTEIIENIKQQIKELKYLETSTKDEAEEFEKK